MPTTTGLGAALRPRHEESRVRVAATALAHCGSSLAISCSTGGCGCRRRGVDGAHCSPSALAAWKLCCPSRGCAHAVAASQAVDTASLIARCAAAGPPNRPEASRRSSARRVREERVLDLARRFYYPRKRWRSSSSSPRKPPLWATCTAEPPWAQRLHLPSGAPHRPPERALRPQELLSAPAAHVCPTRRFTWL